MVEGCSETKWCQSNRKDKRVKAVAGRGGKGRKNDPMRTTEAVTKFLVAKVLLKNAVYTVASDIGTTWTASTKPGKKGLPYFTVDQCAQEARYRFTLLPKTKDNFSKRRLFGIWCFERRGQGPAMGKLRTVS